MYDRRTFQSIVCNNAASAIEVLQSCFGNIPMLWPLLQPRWLNTISFSFMKRGLFRHQLGFANTQGFILSYSKKSFFITWSIVDIKYQFQVYNRVVWHLYTLWNDLQTSLATICQNAKLLQYCRIYSLGCKLYPLPMTCLLCDRNCVPLNPLYLFCPFSHSLSAGNHQFIFCIYEFVSILFCLFIWFVF